jgi:hypothetical protein
MSKEEFIFEGKFSERMIIRRTEDVEPVIEDVLDFKNNTDNGFSKSRNYRKIGSLPLIVIDQWLREKGIDLMKPENIRYVKQALNEMNKFRTVDKAL